MRLFGFPVLGVVGYLVDIGLVAVFFVPSYLVLVPLLGGICGRNIKVLRMIFLGGSGMWARLWSWC
ncbi:MAG: hypothetical protein ACTSXX_06030 [Candidatus Baldrarchaeia archaeon]